MAWVTSAIMVGTAAYGAIKSSSDASAAAKATQKQMKLAATADTAARKAEASAMIARVEQDDFKIKQLEQAGDTLKMQGKADSLLRKNNYNDSQALALVMGAASGRVVGSGSLDAIYDHSAQDYRWEQLWNTNNETISLAALEADKTNIYKSSTTSLRLGAEQLGISRLRSEAGQQNTANAAKMAFDNSMNQSIQTLGKAAAGASKAYGQRPQNLTQKVG